MPFRTGYIKRIRWMVVTIIQRFFLFLRLLLIAQFAKAHATFAYLSQRDMSYAAIPDLREQYHPGDELTCVVKQFDRKADTLEISVKETVPNPFDEASLRHPVGCRRRASIAGKYAGGVFCNLPDGAVVMCRYSFHYEDSDFKTGDTVMVVIQRYDEGKKQIFGKIVGR